MCHFSRFGGGGGFFFGAEAFFVGLLSGFVGIGVFVLGGGARLAAALGGCFVLDALLRRDIVDLDVDMLVFVFGAVCDGIFDFCTSFLSTSDGNSLMSMADVVYSAIAGLLVKEEIKFTLLAARQPLLYYCATLAEWPRLLNSRFSFDWTRRSCV